VVQLLTNATEISRLLDDLVVVEDVVFCRIYWLGEPEGTSQLAALGQDLKG